MVADALALCVIRSLAMVRLSIEDGRFSTPYIIQVLRNIIKCKYSFVLSDI